MTHFFASTGTCGTITGTGRFLKHMSGGKVKVHGIHPAEGHDIPGVRSIAQLKMTEHYQRDAYDEFCEVTNEEAFDMLIRLNREESLIAGPSSGMQVVGALKLMKDEPGNVGVIIFCDDVFKYTTSVTKHCPNIFETSAASLFEPAEEKVLQAVLGLVREGPDTLRGPDLHEVIKPDGDWPRIIDVRAQDEFSSRLRVRGAVNIPLPELTGQGNATENVVQVFDLPGAVQRRQNTSEDEPAAKRPRRSVDDALSTALGEKPGIDAPLLLVCNRGIDSLFGVLTLKAAGYKNVKHVGGGMFTWRDKALPTDEGAELLDLPPAKDIEEEALLKRLGYTSAGKPKA